LNHQFEKAGGFLLGLEIGNWKLEIGNSVLGNDRVSINEKLNLESLNISFLRHRLFDL
jgi:hypothetical protein